MELAIGQKYLRIVGLDKVNMKDLVKGEISVFPNPDKAKNPKAPDFKNIQGVGVYVNVKKAPTPKNEDVL